MGLGIELLDSLPSPVMPPLSLILIALAAIGVLCSLLRLAAKLSESEA